MIARREVRYLAAVAAIGLVGCVVWLLFGQINPANLAILYLVAVIGSAVAFGRGPAILAAVTAFLTFDFLFTIPYYTLRVDDPQEWLTLILFLVAALGTGQLAAALRL